MNESFFGFFLKSAYVFIFQVLAKLVFKKEFRCHAESIPWGRKVILLPNEEEIGMLVVNVLALEKVFSDLLPAALRVIEEIPSEDVIEIFI